MLRVHFDPKASCLSKFGWTVPALALTDASLGQCSRQSRPPAAGRQPGSSLVKAAVRLVCDDRGWLPQSDCPLSERPAHSRSKAPLEHRCTHLDTRCTTPPASGMRCCKILAGLGGGRWPRWTREPCGRCLPSPRWGPVGGGGGTRWATQRGPWTHQGSYVKRDGQTSSCLLCKASSRPGNAKPADGCREGVDGPAKASSCTSLDCEAPGLNAG